MDSWDKCLPREMAFFCQVLYRDTWPPRYVTTWDHFEAKYRAENR